MRRYLNVYFSNSLKDIDFDGKLLEEVKKAKQARGDEIWLIDMFLESEQVLKFAICSHEYIIAHWDEIKPTSREDAHIKLYAYVRYNAYMNATIIELFRQCKYQFNFRYYTKIQICDDWYNPAHTYIYEHIVRKKIRGFTNERLQTVYKLMELVNLKERDSHNNSSLDYIHMSCVRKQLFQEALKIHCHNLASDLIDGIQYEINTKYSSTIVLTNEYLEPLRELHKYAKFREFLTTHDIEIHAELNACKIIIAKKN